MDLITTLLDLVRKAIGESYALTVFKVTAELDLINVGSVQTKQTTYSDYQPLLLLWW